MKKVKKTATKPTFWATLQKNTIKFTKSDNFKYFLIYFALVFVAFCGLLNQTHICDNVLRMDKYDNMSLGEFMNEGTTSINGRWGNIVFYLIHKPLSALGFTYNHNQWIYFLIDMIVIAIGLAILFSVFKKLINPSKKATVALFLSVALIAINPFMVESLAFMIPSHPQTLLCVALAVYFLVSDKKRHFLWATLFAIAAICTYQSYYTHLFVLGLLALYLKNKGKLDKQLALDALKNIGVIVAGMATYFISVAVYCAVMGAEQAKGTSLSLSPIYLVKQLGHVVKLAAKELIRGAGIYHLYGLLAIIFAAVVILLIVQLIRQHKTKTLVWGIVFIGVALVAPVAYGIISSSFYLAPRILISYFAVMASFLILTIYFKPVAKVVTATNIALVIFAAVNIFHCSSLITDIQISNQIEFAEFNLIASEIKAYEEASQQKIDTIVVFSSGHTGEVTFDQVHTNHPNGYLTSHLLQHADWSNVSWLIRTTGEDYTHIEKSMGDDEFKELFPNYSSEQLTRFVPSERLKFDQNTLYWITY